MNENIYHARRQLFNRMDIPVSKADMQILKWKQRSRLMIWETMLRGLFFVKRIIDVLAGTAALILLLPLCLLVAVCIIIEDGFPVIFTQKRVGLDGREFMMYKFRTMCRDAEKMQEALQEQSGSADETRFKLRDDPRVLRCGHFFRRFSMDELPQFLNVLRGDLSIVGPRPPLPTEVRRYSLSERKRLHVKPGLTCLWQISGRSDLPFDEQVSLDMQYIQSQSIWNDFIIVLKTIPAVLFGRGAY